MGGNNWIDGVVETVQNPVDRVTNPYQTVAGAADAGALRFDEGIGGLTSLVDGEDGNTAGSGSEDIDVPLTQIGASDDAADGGGGPVRSADEAVDAAADDVADATLLDELLAGRPVVGVVVILGLLMYLGSDSELPGVST